MTLPLGPMTSPILSMGISKETIFGRRGGHLGPGLGDGAGHDLEDVQPSFLGLEQRLGQHVEGQPVDLGVELQGGDDVLGAGHLEVHVAEGVLGAEDVGEGHVGVAVVDQAHGDAGHRCLDGHAGGHEGQRRPAHRGHRRRPVGGEDVGHQAQGVGELLLRGDHRQQGPLGQEAVPDLTPLGAPHEARLTGREGREVVVVHVPLGLARA